MVKIGVSLSSNLKNSVNYYDIGRSLAWNQVKQFRGIFMGCLMGDIMGCVIEPNAAIFWMIFG